MLVLLSPSTVCLLHDKGNKLRDEVLNQGIATLFGKLGVQEDGGQES